MITVAYLAHRNVLCVTGIPTPFPAGSLQVRRAGDMLAVASPHQDTLICGWADAGSWTRPDGSGFGSADEAYAYLSEACGRIPAQASIMTGTGAPELQSGTFGDLYLDASSGDFYRKET